MIKTQTTVLVRELCLLTFETVLVQHPGQPLAMRTRLVAYNGETNCEYTKNTPWYQLQGDICMELLSRKNVDDTVYNNALYVAELRAKEQLVIISG